MRNKKPLILVAFVIAALIGAYASQYYTWTVDYKVQPLTTSVKMFIPPASGATCGTADLMPEDGPMPEIEAKEPIKLLFMVEDSDTEDLEDKYWSLYLKIKVAGKSCILSLIEFGVDDLQELAGFEDDTLPVINYIEVPPGKGPVSVEAIYWTGAVDVEKEQEFDLNIFAIEPEDISVAYNLDLKAYYADDSPWFTDTWTGMTESYEYSDDVFCGFLYYKPGLAEYESGNWVMYQKMFSTWATWQKDGIMRKDVYRGLVTIEDAAMVGEYIQYAFAKGDKTAVLAAYPKAKYATKWLVSDLWFIGRIEFTAYP